MGFSENKNRLFLAFLVFFLFLAFSCSGPRHESVTVDFSTSTEEGDDYAGHDSLPVLRVAIATVISPRESFVYYKELFDYISQRLHLKVEFKQRMTYQEVNELLAQNLVDIAFICSGAYVVGSENMELLVVPVHNGLPYYQGYIITQQNSAFTRFEDFRGKSFTYSDPLCFTGKLFIDGKLKGMGTSSDEFFSQVLYSSSHDISIQMVSRNLADGASVNGLIFDYLSQFQPEAIQNIRLIEKSNYFGIPPIVNSRDLDRSLRSEIQELFLDMHLHEQGRQIMYQLQVDRFILAGDTLYDGIRQARKFLEP
jgi:phosphonate transport system substrate-binding protein